jgi:GNAT superfamily N-acetyltransferase
MDINQRKISAKGIKFSITKDKTQIARAFLYIMHNDLHKEPFGLMEDVYVEESYRGKGLGTKIVKQLIKAAQKEGCYKLIATSRYNRPKVHKLYTKLGFKKQGLEFRIDF